MSKDTSKKVSFVVPVYKTEKHLKRCLDSLIDQDYKNTEIICVLDGDSPEAKGIIKNSIKLHKKDIKVVEIPHSGVQKARNKGYEYTTGDYVSFWDSDCYAEPGMCRVWVLAFEQNPDVGFVYSGYRFTEEAGFPPFPSERFDAWKLTCGNYIATMFPMKREIFPGFDENLKSLQDWDIWLTLTEQGYKGFWIEGTGFITEPPREGGISTEGCSKENWLERFNAVRNKHNIKNRDICVTSVYHPDTAENLGKLLGGDFQYQPSYHPHEYKMIYKLGFYAQEGDYLTKAFKDASKECKKVIHWMGTDIETIYKSPYEQVKELAKLINKSITKNFCENEIAQKQLDEIGINAEVNPFPMEYQDIPEPEKFKVFFDSDKSTEIFLRSLAKAMPDIEIDSPDRCELKNYACYLTVTQTKYPSENFKRFLLAGKYVVTNYQLPYSNHISIEGIDLNKYKTKIVDAIRKIQSKWEKGERNEEAKKYYRRILNVERFKKSIIELCSSSI